MERANGAVPPLFSAKFGSALGDLVVGSNHGDEVRLQKRFGTIRA